MKRIGLMICWLLVTNCIHAQGLSYIELKALFSNPELNADTYLQTNGWKKGGVTKAIATSLHINTYKKPLGRDTGYLSLSYDSIYNSLSFSFNDSGKYA